MAHIVVQELTKHFARDTRPAVDQVSFEVRPGSFVVLLGPSGCGKTTLLKTINRLYEPDAGRILIDGQDIQSLRGTLLRRKIGYVIQQVGLFPHMRIAENIAVVPRLLGWERSRIDARINELLDLIGLPRSYRQRYPRQLSGGEQQRIGLARALAADPGIMLMDEPFGAIDAITRTRLQDELLMIQRKLQKTILFVTHDVEEALKLADSIIVMRSGQIVQYGTPLEIVTHPHDEFVRDLLGTTDLLRRLSLISVESLLATRNGQHRPDKLARTVDSSSVQLNDDLRVALIRLLSANGAALQVQDAEGQALAALDFDDIRSALNIAAEPLESRVH